MTGVGVGSHYVYWYTTEVGSTVLICSMASLASFQNGAFSIIYGPASGPIFPMPPYIETLGSKSNHLASMDLLTPNPMRLL